MQYRNCLTVLMVAAVSACSSGSDVTTAPLDIAPAAARGDEGVKPPPPAGSEEVSISFNICGDFGESEGGCGFESAERIAADNAPFAGFFGNPKGRYFANTQSTNGWIDFETGNGIIASPNARLSYNGKLGRTTGRGTLTLTYFPFSVLDLSKLVIVDGNFGGCIPFEGGGEGGGFCTSLEVEYLGNPGSIFIRLVFPGESEGAGE